MNLKRPMQGTSSWNFRTSGIKAIFPKKGWEKTVTKPQELE